jgi:peptidyl-prolyl isomerase E (cyclophilin E)
MNKISNAIDIINRILLLSILSIVIYILYKKYTEEEEEEEDFKNDLDNTKKKNNLDLYNINDPFFDDLSLDSHKNNKIISDKIQYESDSISQATESFGSIGSILSLKKHDKNKYPYVYFNISIDKHIIGKIIFKLYVDKVPRTVLNFIKLATEEKGYGYKNSIFHRIIPNFMIQGGDFERQDGSGGTSIYGKCFEDESFEIKHDRHGLLSMANSGPNTNGSQFFITLDMLPHLDGKHVVFGEVINGFEIVEEIAKYGTVEGKPEKQIIISDCNLLN